MFHGTQQEGQSQAASDGASGGAGLGRRRECFAAYRSPPSVAATQRYRRLSGIEAGLGGEIRRDSRAEMLHCATSVQFCCSKIKQASWGLPRAFDPQLALFTRKSSLLSRREAVFSVPVGGGNLPLPVRLWPLERSCIYLFVYRPQSNCLFSVPPGGSRKSRRGLSGGVTALRLQKRSLRGANSVPMTGCEASLTGGERGITRWRADRRTGSRGAVDRLRNATAARHAFRRRRSARRASRQPDPPAPASRAGA